MAANSPTVCSFIFFKLCAMNWALLVASSISGGHPFSFTGVFEITPRDHDELGEQFRFR